MEFLSATLPIVDLWQCCACYLRLRVTQFIFERCIALAVCAGACYSWCFERCIAFAVCTGKGNVVLWLPIFMHSFAPPRCRTSQYRRNFVPLSVSLWNDLGCSVFDGVGLAGFKSRANAFLLA